MSSRLTTAFEDADDRCLVAGARAGDDEAFAVLVRRYRRELVGHARRVVSSADAEDVVQVALLRVYGALRDGGVEPVLLGPWLHRIVHNAGLDMLRRRVAPPAVGEAVGSPAPDPHEALTQRERIRALTAAIRELPDGEREALVGHELEGRSHEELGRAGGRTEVAVRQAARRARVRLRRAVFGWAPAGWAVRLLELPGRAAEAVVPGAPGLRAAGCLALVAAGAVAVGSGHLPSGGSSGQARARAPGRAAATRAAAPHDRRAAATPARGRPAATAPPIVARRGGRGKGEHESGRGGRRGQGGGGGRGPDSSSGRPGSGSGGGPGPSARAPEPTGSGGPGPGASVPAGGAASGGPSGGGGGSGSGGAATTGATTGGSATSASSGPGPGGSAGTAGSDTSGGSSTGGAPAVGAGSGSGDGSGGGGPGPG